MSSRPVRISEVGHKILCELVKEDHKSMPEILENILKAEKKRRFFEGLNAGYIAMKNDPSAWQVEMEERALLENTLMDGLDPDEVWSRDGKRRE